MKKNNKEFEELRTQFERDLGKMPVYVPLILDREPRDSKYYYCHGEVNALFVAYMTGYQFARCLTNL